MHILFVSPFLPSPPRFGGQRRIHGLMTALHADGHHVSLVAPRTEEDDVHGSVAATAAYCDDLATVDDRGTSSIYGKRLGQLRSLVSLRSWEHRTYDARPPLAPELERLLGSRTYDAVVFEFVFTAPALTARARGLAGGACFVLDEHNIEYDIVRRTSHGGLDRRLFASMNWRKLRREERAAWRAFDGCTVTSQRDAELLLEDEKRVPTRVVPNGVDVGYFRPVTPTPAVDATTILFFGANNYFPNVDGIQYFLREVFPLVQRRVPGAKLKVVGPAPDSLKKLAGPSLEVTGFVDDLRPHVLGAGVVIAPLRIGGGTRLKILEAMALGKAVVSTSIGAEGLDVEHDRELLLGDDAVSFARAVGDLLLDPRRAHRLGAEARSLVERLYSWNAAAGALAEFIERLRRDKVADARRA